MNNNKKNNKKVALYSRVSTDAQYEEGYSIDAQKEQLEAYCISKGMKNFEHYIDGGWSGGNIERPELERLVKEVEDQNISYVVVYKLDRLSRSQKDTLYLIEDVFMPNNVEFVSLTESLDTSNPMGRAMIGILAAFAQLERENIRMRTRMGMKERVKEGYWMGGGRVPFGYDYDREKGILVKNKDADTVKKIYALYLQGYSCQSIANMLGLKYDRLALQILKRKTNYGIIEYNGVEYQGRHEAIISKEIYDNAMDMFKKRSATNLTTSSHLLAGLVYCGKCGAKMRYQPWGKSGHKFMCYSQQTYKPYLIKDKNCDQEKIDCNIVEDIVINRLFQLKEERRDMTNKEYNISAIDVLLQQKKSLENKIRRLYNLYAGQSDDLLLITINENKEALHEIELKIKSEKKQLEDVSNSNTVKNAVDTLSDQWYSMTNKERQTIVRILVNKIILTGETVEVNLNV